MFSKVSLKAQLLRGGLGSVVVKFTFALLSFLLTIVLARVLGAEAFGAYAFALAVIMLIAIPALVGVPELMVRETAKAQTKEDWALLQGLWQWGHKVVLYFSVIVAVLGFLAAVLFFDIKEDPRTQAILVGLLVIPIMALVNVKSACVRGLRHTVLGQLPENIIRPAFLLLLIFLVPLYTEVNEPVSVMAFYVISALLSLFVSVLLFKKLKPLSVFEVKNPKFEIDLWRKAVMPLALISGLQVINSYADIIILGLFRADDEVGVYRAVVQLSLLVSFGLQAINQVLHPHFSRLYTLGDQYKLQKLVTVSARIILMISLPPVVLFVFYGADILTLLFGDPFYIGGLALAVLAVGQLVNATMGSVGALLNMTGHERYTVRGVAIAAISNIVLNIILIPPYGMAGAAISTAVSMALWNILLRYYVQKKLNIEPSGLFRVRVYK